MPTLPTYVYIRRENFLDSPSSSLQNTGTISINVANNWRTKTKEGKETVRKLFDPLRVLMGKAYVEGTTE